MNLPSGECRKISLVTQVKTGSGNGLVPSGNKPLPEPILTQIFVAQCRHQAAMSSHVIMVYSAVWLTLMCAPEVLLNEIGETLKFVDAYMRVSKIVN